MAQIREELILVDKFTTQFTSFMNLTDQSSSAIRDLKFSLANIETATASAANSMQELANHFSNTKKKSDETGTSFDSVTRKVMSLVGAYAGFQGLSALFSLSDTMTQTTARLDMMNDGLQTTAELNQMIYESAQRSRGSYQDTADMVAKLGNLAGDAFNSSQELVAFAEQLNKQITLSGASTAASDAAMLQLTQAMSSGVLRGEELNSILEQTPTIAKAIADYMGVSTGTMREMASEGAITADVVKNAMFAAAEETNAKFEQMPMTWRQVWTSFKNTATMALQPVLNGINWAANNLDILIPIVGTAGAAFAVFLLAANWTNICTGATTALANAQKMLNAVMATGWGIPLIAIIAVVGAVYLLVAAYNNLTGSSVSATGIIAGAFLAMGAFIINSVIVPMVNTFSAAGNFVMNVFNDPVAAVKVLFLDMVTTVLGWVSNLAHGIESVLNMIPGVEVNVSSGIDSFYNSVKQKSQTIKDESGWKEYFGTLNNIDLGKAYSTGYNWGSNLFSGSESGFSVPSYTASAFSSGSPTYDQVSGISDSVGDIQKSVQMTDEDLQSLVDIAERQYVNNINLTSQAPVINVSGQNTGNTQADRINLANTLRDILIQQVASGSVQTTAKAF